LRRLLRGRYANLLITYLGPQRGRMALLATVLLASIGLQLLVPQTLRSFIDTARGGPPDAPARFALLFLGIVLLNQVLSPAVTYLSEVTGWTALNRLRSDLTLHCLRLDQSFHTARTPGELIERVDGDVNALANFFSQFIIRILGNALLLAGALLALLREDWRVGLALAAFVALALPALRWAGGLAVPYFRAHRQAFADVSGFWEERVGGAEDIRGVGAIPATLTRQLSLLQTHARAATASLVMGRITQSMWEMLLAIGNALVFTLGAALLYRGTLTIGAIYLIFAYTELVARNLFAITQQIDDLQRARAGIERIQELLERPNPLQDGSAALPPGPLEVRFERVSFAYGQPGAEGRAGNAAAVLAGVSLVLAPGQVLGVLGRTGSGKTTLVRLLARFADPTEGAIRLGGQDLRELRVAEMRRRIGFVSQDVQLFHGTVRDNLTFWDTAVPDAALLSALHELGLSEWYARLPHGLDTPLAPGGGGLSAGEAQLLALARIFLQDPGLVIMDEASARLDPLTERLIETALNRLLAGRTAVIIAHRLDTLLRADLILALEAGRVVEHGPRAALQGDPASRFAELLRAGQSEVLP
jgi:ATP-binding cassette subfamily B protein